ncbi:MAG: amidohydrolase [Rhodospirillaceae bacterium]
MEPAANPHVPVRPDWLARRSEPVLDPDLPIVDAHHHLWDRPGWRYMLPELAADMARGHNVVASVYAQCRTMYRTDGPEELRPVGEVEFTAAIAARCAAGPSGAPQACAAIVGCANLSLGERVEPVLEALIRAGGGRLAGIRNQTAWHPDPAISSSPVQPRPGLLRSEAFGRGVAVLARYGLSLDVWAYHTQLGDLYDLAREHPDVRIVIDHCGGPLGVGPYAGRTAEVFAVWRDAMRRLSRLPNVRLKLGGLGMKVAGFSFHERPLPPSSADLAEAWRPLVETCIDLFGPHNCMFESNFPVDNGQFSYPILWNAFKRLAAGFTQGERTRLFAGTAAEVYGLPFGIG